jgi:hypothetical protein
MLAPFSIEGASSKSGAVQEATQPLFKSAPNKISLQAAPLLDLRLGAGHLTGQ